MRHYLSIYLTRHSSWLLMMWLMPSWLLLWVQCTFWTNWIFTGTTLTKSPAACLTGWPSAWRSDSNIHWCAWTTISVSLMAENSMRHPVLEQMIIVWNARMVWISWLWQLAPSMRRWSECWSDSNWRFSESLCESLLKRLKIQHTNLTLRKTLTVVLIASLLIYFWENCISLHTDAFFDKLDCLDLLHTWAILARLRHDCIFEKVELWKMLTKNGSLNEFCKHIWRIVMSSTFSSEITTSPRMSWIHRCLSSIDMLWSFWDA